MAQLEQAAGDAPNDTFVATEPTIEDRFAQFTDELPEEAPVEDAPEGDLHPEDVAALEADAAEVEIDDSDLPPITPPVSWTAEEKAEFSDLPRALQETLTRREAEREKFVQSKAQEVKATQQKAEQAANERLAQERSVHVQTLQALLPEVPARPDPRMNINNPVEYANQLAQYEYAIAQHQQVQQVVSHYAAQQEAAQQAATQQEAQENEAILREKFPEYFSEQRTELVNNLRSTALALGYSEDQLTHVNAQDVLAMKAVSELKAKADKYDTLMAKQMERVREGKKLPAISRPGTPQGKGAAQNQRYEADRNAMRGGDADATARVFSRFL